MELTVWVKKIDDWNYRPRVKWKKQKKIIIPKILLYNFPETD